MKYPDEFVERVIREYVEWPGYLARLMEAFAKGRPDGNIEIGNILENGKNWEYNMNSNQILAALENDDVGSARDMMESGFRKCIRRRKLHKEWLELMGQNEAVPSGDTAKEAST